MIVVVFNLGQIHEIYVVSDKIMNFYLRVALIISIIFVTSVIFFLWWSQNASNIADVGTIKKDIGLETSSVERIETGGTTNFPIKEDNVETLPVRDFKSDPGVTSWGDDATLVLGDGLIADEPAFQIFYYEADKSFSIAILQEPIAEVRTVAEVQLLERLQISATDACKLFISVTVPSFVNENLSGQNLGLSFCPGAVQL